MGVAGASSSPTGMGVSTEPCRFRGRWPRGASSSPTGMGVSTRAHQGHRARCPVRPRHRRGWESQHEASVGRLVHGRVRPRHRRGWESQHGAHHRRPPHRLCASSSPTGMGVSTGPWRVIDGRLTSASSSPTGMGVSTSPGCGRRSCRRRCVLVTDGDGSLNSRWVAGRVGGSRVRPRHRRGWESQPCSGSHAIPEWTRCVLVTDGDGSLNPGSGGIARAWERASSSPTGMGVSTSTGPPRASSAPAVRPRHRRGWESQPPPAVHARCRIGACVLVTDGDGSLNGAVHPRQRRRQGRASSSPTGMGVSTAKRSRSRCRRRPCVLVTDGDGSLNVGA